MAKSPAPLTSCRTVPLRPTLLRIPVRRVDPCSLLLLCLYVKDFPRRVRLSCSASGGMSRCNLPGENQSRVHLPLPTAFLTILTAVSVTILPIRAAGHSSGPERAVSRDFENFCALVKLRLWGKKTASLCFGLRGDASVVVPPFLGGDLWGSAGQVSDYLPSNTVQTGRAFR